MDDVSIPPGSSQVHLSLVVPTHGRAAHVHRLLQSIGAAAKIYGGSLEIIVVDSSEDSQATSIERSCQALGATYLREVNNVRRKRNKGFGLARHPVVLFIDSDCEATPSLLAEHARSYDADDGIGGVAGVTKFTGEASWLWRVIEHTSMLDAFRRPQHMATVTWAPTCNVSYRKDVLNRVGGFDVSFPFRLGGDDVDLGLRVTDAGYQIKSNPAAVVLHHRDTWTGLGLIVRRAFRWGRMHYHLMQKHRHRALIDFPKTASLFVVLVTMGAPVWLATRSSVAAAYPVLWLGLTLGLEATIASILLDRPMREGLYEVGARLLGLTFEFGTIYEGLRHADLAVLYREISLAPPSLQGRLRRAAQIWASILGLLLLLMLGTLVGS